jgi:hypothetical protein
MPKFDSDLRGPKSDEEGVRRVYDALVKAGYRIGVQDGAREEFPPPMSKDDAVSEVMSCDDGFFIVFDDDSTEQQDRFGYIYFVYGNEPGEVVCDYTTNLEHVIEPLTKNWL